MAWPTSNLHLALELRSQLIRLFQVGQLHALLLKTRCFHQTLRKVSFQSWELYLPPTPPQVTPAVILQWVINHRFSFTTLQGTPFINGLGSLCGRTYKSQVQIQLSNIDYFRKCWACIVQTWKGKVLLWRNYILSNCSLYVFSWSKALLMISMGHVASDHVHAGLHQLHQDLPKHKVTREHKTTDNFLLVYDIVRVLPKTVAVDFLVFRLNAVSQLLQVDSEGKSRSLNKLVMIFSHCCRV